MTRLIINADDFGLTPGINNAILTLNRSHAVTSATLMATASECASAAAAALAQSSLGVGCHVVFVDGIPALRPNRIPSLVVRTRVSGYGAFRPTLGAFVRDLLLGLIDDGHMEAEATAQIRRLQTLGIRVTHVDTHKHAHIFPRVLRPLLRAALACGVKAIRNPFEPPWSIAATPHAGMLRRLQQRALNTQQSTFLRLTREAELKTTDGTLGILATGILDIETLRAILGRLPCDLDATYELCCHPGYQDAALDAVATRLRRSREIEIEALDRALSGNLTATLNGLERIHYGDL